MTTNITSHRWRGDWAAPVAPAAIQFTAAAAPVPGECAGCLFADQRVAVCDQAGAIAAAADLPECSPRTGPTFIYVLDKKTDPRQVRITKSEAATGLPPDATFINNTTKELN